MQKNLHHPSFHHSLNCSIKRLQNISLYRKYSLFLFISLFLINSLQFFYTLIRYKIIISLILILILILLNIYFLKVESKEKSFIFRCLKDIEAIHLFDDLIEIKQETLNKLLDQNKEVNIRKDGSHYFIKRGYDLNYTPSLSDNITHFSKEAIRVDAMQRRVDIDAVELLPSRSELMMEEAEKIRGEKMSLRWAEEENKDSELIESGVTKLGDFIEGSRN